MTHEERLEALGRSDGWLTDDYKAVLAGAEALRLLREYQEAASVVRALNEDGGGPSAEVFSAACDRYDATKDALLATEVTR